MQSYNNSESGVGGYEYGSNYITVYFKKGGRYTYTYGSCGSSSVETMKMLADNQDGLCTFINQNKPPYSSKN